MKKGWHKTTLGEVFTTVTGNTPSKSNPEFFGNYMPLVKPPELLDAPVDSAEDGLSEAGSKVARIAPPNSILVSCIGNLGKVGLNTVPVAFNQQINAISPDENRAVSEFMFYQVLSCDFKGQLEALSSGTTVPIVNKSRFNSIKVVLPPLPEQQRIVALLDEAFAGLATAKANAERNLQNARALFESHLQSVFSQRGWPIRRIGDLSEMVTKGTTPTSVGHSFVQQGINFVKIESITKTGSFVEERFAHITAECHADLGRSQLAVGDILFSIAGALGRTALVTDEILPANTNQALAIIRLKHDSSLLPKFVLKALGTGVVLEQIEQFWGGAAQQNLSLAQVRDFHIAQPPLAMQQKIVANLDAFSVETQRLTRLYQRKLAALEELKKSLLHQAFNGEL